MVTLQKLTRNQLTKALYCQRALIFQGRNATPANVGSLFCLMTEMLEHPTETEAIFRKSMEGADVEASLESVRAIVKSIHEDSDGPESSLTDEQVRRLICAASEHMAHGMISTMIDAPNEETMNYRGMFVLAFVASLFAAVCEGKFYEVPAPEGFLDQTTVDRMLESTIDYVWTGDSNASKSSTVSH